MLDVLEDKVVFRTPERHPAPSLCLMGDNAVNVELNQLFQLLFPAIEIGFVFGKQNDVVMPEQDFESLVVVFDGEVDNSICLVGQFVEYHMTLAVFQRGEVKVETLFDNLNKISVFFYIIYPEY